MMPEIIEYELTFSGVGLFFAYKGISEQLQRVRKLTEVTHDESQGRKLDEEAEDGMSYPETP